MSVEKAIIAFYLLGLIASVGIIIYLIIRRINKKRLEDFEKRDN